MSGFIPDLANWALRGGAGGNDNNENQETTGQSLSNNEETPLTAEELRAQRLARMEELQRRQQQAEPMDVDSPKAAPAPAPVPAPKPAPTPTSTSPTPQPPEKKRKDAPDSARKMQRKKELLLKKTLSIALAGTSSASDSSLKVIDIDSAEISVQSVAEILATRLSAPPSPMDKPLIAYLALSHRRASEELKTMEQTQKKSQELCDIVQEMQRQVVSYAASILMEPDLFEAGHDAREQLAQCLLAASTDVASSITFGVAGPASSFYHRVVDELVDQDANLIDDIVGDICRKWIAQLLRCESVLDSVDSTDGLMLVTALAALASHKRAAVALTKLDCFLLPRPNTPQASELIRPPMPTGGNLLQMIAGENRPYKKRSGPAVEKQTLLGAALRLGVPKNNAAFSPTSIFNLSLDSIERTTSTQRNQLRVHQQACCQLVLALVKAGAEARSAVMQWFTDTLEVNFGASAMRPDPTKVSSTNLLLNASVVLLKLCEPFVDDEKKLKLIDPGFVSSPSAHSGVFATEGDNAVPRLGEHVAAMDTYNPKNSFIPQCFFLCARSLHFGLVPALSYHESLQRHISHAHWDITSNGRDIRSDPHFGILLCRQRSAEVALFQPDMVSDSVRFGNYLARFLLSLSDEDLRTMPEDFVNDLCAMIMSIVKLKPKLVAGLELRYVFKLMVKLLSASYAEMVRNYNLRAMLGDVLYDLFLPPAPGDRRDVPSTAYADLAAGGQPYLLSVVEAQETLAPSLLLLYGEVEHTGYYDKMSHRAKIASLIKFLWESAEHRPAFRRITQNRESFVKFANGIINETNTLIATVMQKLPEIREAQERMKNTAEWGQLSEDEQAQVSSRLEDNEREVKYALPLCNKTMQMFGYLNTDPDIRALFLTEELCDRLVTMLLHVLTKLVGSRGLDLKVDNPEQYDFRPKEMLRDLCAIFSLFSASPVFQEDCAKSGCDPGLLQSAVKTCRRLNLLTGDSMTAFEALPDLVQAASIRAAAEEALVADAPDEYLDELMMTYMQDPVLLPSGHVVNRQTITRSLLNDPIDPFSRQPMTLNDLTPATELKQEMDEWLEMKRAKVSNQDIDQWLVEKRRMREEKVREREGS